MTNLPPAPILNPIDILNKYQVDYTDSSSFIYKYNNKIINNYKENTGNWNYKKILELYMLSFNESKIACEDMGITSVPILPNMTHFYGEQNELTSFPIQPNMRHFYGRNNRLKSFSIQPKMTYFDGENNQITSFPIQPMMDTFIGNNNKLTSFPIQPKMTYFDGEGNQLTSFPIQPMMTRCNADPGVCPNNDSDTESLNEMEERRINTEREYDTDSREFNDSDNESSSRFGIGYSNIEEDQPFEELTSDMSDLNEPEPFVSAKCKNDDIMSMEPYNIDDKNDVFIMYLIKANSNKFDTRGICCSKDEIKEYLKSDLDEDYPSSLMTLWTGTNMDVTGMPGKPSARVVVKMPPYNTYITYGSLVKIMKNDYNKEWYLLPLYGGKRRRIGNFQGTFGVSLNHGQTPGFIIYKAYTRKQIELGVNVKEDYDDYPFYFYDNTVSLFKIFENFEIKNFTNTLIANII